MSTFIACWLLLFCSAGGSHPKRSSIDDVTISKGKPVNSVPKPPRYHPADRGVAVGTQGAVVSAESHASRVGLEVLRKGGNAVDAAVAVGFALAVTHPSAGNIGGGGFMVIRMADGTATCIDYRETAPARASSDMYLDEHGNLTKDRLLGARAAGIPGTVAGMALSHQRFGTRKWAELLAPAIRLAQKGHVIDESHSGELKRAVAAMVEAGLNDAASHYLNPEGHPIRAGELWKQPELAQTLQMLAEKGPDWFYRGSFAKHLVSQMQAVGGIWRLEDLKKYKAIERRPITFDYRGYQVISMPPPSAGGVVLRQILAVSEIYRMYNYPWHSVEEIHLYVEAARRSYADRNYWLGDPAFVTVPIEKLTSMRYIKSRMGTIDLHKATPSHKVAPGTLPKESEETTHYSVVDRYGNAVSNTYTLNTGFGAKLVIPKTGILLNNEMDDFASMPGRANTYGLIQGNRNRIEPGKRMLSSMTPTILTKKGKLRAVLGTPGGPTITTTVVQLVRNLIDYRMPLDDAVRAPRIHHQWQPDQIFVETELPKKVKLSLQKMGHKVTINPRGPIGHAMCIEVDPETSGLRAVADITRGSGEAVAY